jgi:hypothetical protein
LALLLVYVLLAQSAGINPVFMAMTYRKAQAGNSPETGTAVPGQALTGPLRLCFLLSRFQGNETGEFMAQKNTGAWRCARVFWEVLSMA